MAKSACLTVFAAPWFLRFGCPSLSLSGLLWLDLMKSQNEGIGGYFVHQFWGLITLTCDAGAIFHICALMSYLSLRGSRQRNYWGSAYVGPVCWFSPLVSVWTFSSPEDKIEPVKSLGANRILVAYLSIGRAHANSRISYHRLEVYWKAQIHWVLGEFAAAGRRLSASIFLAYQNTEISVQDERW